MSVQTGVETPSGPRSRRVGDRMRHRFALWRDDPNPIWLREMRQSARLTRTPIILMVLTVLLTLLMASIGGVLTGTASPAEAGQALFHTYFSLAFFVVALVGPALAANSIASEREGKTWEALLLTGMHPAVVTRGKFLSAYTAMATYIVMLAPVGALPFLFGGITPFEVLVAFAFLFLAALLAVAFGLAISAKMESLRAALLVTLLVAVPLSGFAFGIFGVAMSELINDLWAVVPDGPPVWLPTAFSRAPFGYSYVAYLIVFPVVLIALPAWLLYEITLANLTSATDDRSYGVKRWYLAATALLTPLALAPMPDVDGDDRHAMGIAAMCALTIYVVFCAFLFGGEAIGPSRRVKRALRSGSALRRWLGPGVLRTAWLQIFANTVALIVMVTVTLNVIEPPAMGLSRTIDTMRDQVLLFALYVGGFAIFVVGLGALLRARSTSTMLPRVLLLVILFFVCVGPWILAAITGVLSGGTNEYGPEFAVASPSPFYVFVGLSAIEQIDPGVAIAACLVASMAYAALGLILMLAAGRRCKSIIDEHERLLTEADNRLAAEDEAADDAAAESDEPAGEPEERDKPEDPGEPEDLGESEETDEPEDPGEPEEEIGTTSDDER